MEANDPTAVNAKRFRKIAKMIRRLVDHIRKEKSLPEKLARETFDQVDDLAKEALIAPPRNCDRTFSDRTAMFAEFKAWCHGRGYAMEPFLAWDAFDWLLAEAKEGGAE